MEGRADNWRGEPKAQPSITSPYKTAREGEHLKFIELKTVHSLLHPTVPA